MGYLMVVLGGATYVAGAAIAAAWGESDLIVDLLAGGGIGAIVGQLVILRRARAGVRGRSSEIIAAWTAFGTGTTLVIYVISEVT